MLFMVIERFKDRNAKALYGRLKEKGRMMPDGLKYVGSWIETNFDRCFQVMECDNERLLQDGLTTGATSWTSSSSPSARRSKRVLLRLATKDRRDEALQPDRIDEAPASSPGYGFVCTTTLSRCMAWAGDGGNPLTA